MKGLLNGTKILLSKEKIHSMLNKKEVSSVRGLIEKNNGKVELQVNDSFAFETFDKENVLVSGTGLILTNQEKDVFLNIFEEEQSGEEGITVSAFFTEQVNNDKVLNKVVYKNGEQTKFVVQPFTEKTKDILEVNATNELFPVKEDFEQISLKELEGDFETEDYPAWYWGCLPGGYLWCGGDCDNFYDQGGDGYWINDTDWCCRQHDGCLRYDRDTTAGCDRELCNCVAGQTTKASYFIELWFC